MLTIAVAAALDCPAAHQINRATEQSGELLLHIGPVEKRRMSIRAKCRRQINVAVVVKIVAKGRAEQLETFNSALPTESAQVLPTEVQLHAQDLSCAREAVKSDEMLKFAASLPSAVGTGAAEAEADQQWPRKLRI